MDKIYFYDTGVRNALINNFVSIPLRNDKGQIWENFLIAERVKMNSYKERFANSYFWRTYSGAELDLVEEREGRLHGYEFKWGSKTSKPPVSWTANYTGSTFKCINSYRDSKLNLSLSGNNKRYHGICFERIGIILKFYYIAINFRI